MVKERWPEYSVFWFPALGMESMEQTCGRIARMKRIPYTADNKEDIKEIIRRYLSSESAGKWLLVIDNADDMETVFGTDQLRGIIDFLPESKHGLTLFTTRVQEIAVLLADSEVLEVEEMERQGAVAFLNKSLIRKELLDDYTATTRILDELTYLPLAIAQAAAFLNTNKNVSIADYLRLLQNTEQDFISLLSQEFYDRTRYQNSKNAVAKTWLLSFDQIRNRDSVAADLLSFMSCIEWKAIPRSILPSIQPEQRMVRALGTLCGYSLVVKRGDEDKYEIRRLVHLATRIWIENYGTSVETVKKAVLHISNIFPYSLYENRALRRDYLTHALQLLRNELSKEIDERYTLCLKIGQSYQEEGRIREAVEWYEDCLRWRVRTLPEENKYRLASQHALGCAYLVDGRNLKAVKLLEHVVKVQETTLVKEHPDQLISLHVLARAYLADGKFLKAAELLEYVVRVNEKISIEEHPGRLSSQHALGCAYLENGRNLKAVKLLEHVVKVQETTLVKEHPELLKSQHSLACAYLANKQITKAMELFEYVVKVEETTLIAEHQDRLASQHELARVYKADLQIPKAVALLEHVVKVKRGTLRADHPSLLRSQNLLESCRRLST